MISKSVLKNRMILYNIFNNSDHDSSSVFMNNQDLGHDIALNDDSLYARD